MNGIAFADTADLASTETMWQGISQSMATASKVRFDTSLNYIPQVAVFVDEKSPSYQPIIGGPSKDNVARAHKFTMGALDQINKSGIAYREYLLSDLLLGNIL